MEWFEITAAASWFPSANSNTARRAFRRRPLCIALLDYGAFKVFGRIGKDVSEKTYRRMPMKTVVNRLPNGQLNYVFVKV